VHLHQAERVLAAHGFTLERVESSHRHYVNSRGRRLTLSAHGRRLAISPDHLRKDIARLARECELMRGRAP
jgi:predicted RNA binding protein YcfA (HicA-like mRNA interferase family)